MRCFSAWNEAIGRPNAYRPIANSRVISNARSAPPICSHARSTAARSSTRSSSSKPLPSAPSASAGAPALGRVRRDRGAPEPRPAVDLGNRRPLPAHLGGGLPQLGAPVLARLEHLAVRLQRRVLGEEIARRLLQELLVFGEIEVHTLMIRGRIRANQTAPDCRCILEE